MSDFGFDLGSVFIDDPTETKTKLKHNCESCGLSKSCRNPQIPVQGTGKLPILFIGAETPKAQEDMRKNGSNYLFLRDTLRDLGITLEDCLYVDAIRCYNSEDNTKVATLGGCHSLLMADILKFKPSVIVPTSSLAMDTLLYNRTRGRAKSASFFDYAGECIPDQELKTWILPLFETSNVRQEVERNKEKQRRGNPFGFYHPYYKEHIQKIVEYIDKPVPDYSAEHLVRIATSPSEIYEAVSVISSWDVWAFDYETSGIKSQLKKHWIECVSFSNGKVAYAFPWLRNNEQFLGWMRGLMTNKALKVAHNSTFERAWTINKLGVDVTNLRHDTMIAQHIRHNKKPTGLKFCTFAYFGIIGYDEDVEQYLKSSTADKKLYGANAFNAVDQAPPNKLLSYCALDSIYEYWLAEKLINNMDLVYEKPGYELFVQAEPALTRMHNTGFRIDMERLDYWVPIVQEKVDRAYLEIMDHPLIVKEWRHGKFKPSSDDHIRILMFKMLKYEPVAYTDSGLPAVDIDSLRTWQYEIDLINPLIEYKKWQKTINTFLMQLKREAIQHEDGDWYVHGFFNLNNIDSYRSGSREPNLQNISKRQPDVAEIVRSCFLPLRGHKMRESDYSSLEVRGNACITRDSSLVNYVSSPDADMHSDRAKSLFILEDVPKPTRLEAKTTTFQSFYGSYHVQVAQSTWRAIQAVVQEKTFGMDMKGHLATRGITTYEQWEAHNKKADDFLWGTMFPEYQDWRKTTYEEFAEKGFIYLPTGFTYHGPASRNALLNAPGQGSSFHLNLWAIIQIDREIQERGLESRLLAEVHDSQVASIAPGEEQIISYLTWLYGTQKIKEKYDWVYGVEFPMEVDETPEPDMPWSAMKSIGVLENPYEIVDTK